LILKLVRVFGGDSHLLKFKNRKHEKHKIFYQFMSNPSAFYSM